MSTISIVINTWNSADTLRTCLESVKSLGEIIIVDMRSTDDTIAVAKEYTSHIYHHEYVGYVEPARNFAIEKASKEWILVLDSDEEIQPELASELDLISKNPSHYTHYFIPRKNIIFGQWVKHSGWWPDARLRFFKKGTVTWHSTIHGDPPAEGEGHTFPAEERYAIIHHHYTSVSQWIQRMDRYTSVQAKELVAKGYQYQFADNLTKPFSEFLRRFFAWEGYKDGVIGLNLSFLQALSELVVYLKIKELQKESSKEPSQDEFKYELNKFVNQSAKELHHWLYQTKIQNRITQFVNRLKI